MFFKAGVSDSAHFEVAWRDCEKMERLSRRRAPLHFLHAAAMKKIVAVLSLSLAFCAPCAFAQPATPAPAVAKATDPATLAAANALLLAMDFRSVAKNSFGLMRKSMPALMQQGIVTSINNSPKLDAAQKTAALEKMKLQLPQALSAVDAMFDDPALLDEMVAETAQLYARHFTAPELRQIATFYKSPVGVKMVATMPQLGAESMQMGQRIVMPRIAAILQKVQAGK